MSQNDLVLSHSATVGMMTYLRLLILEERFPVARLHIVGVRVSKLKSVPGEREREIGGLLGLFPLPCPVL